ncbi:MAG TPA: DUF3014 domain-containing protein [Vicinamibacterales bacterium]|nr:DUF3014 domain-containing protein [Vicinamibacterales bacterium]
MVDLNDLQLDKWRTPIEPEHTHSRLRVAVVSLVVIAAVAAAGYYLLWRRSQPAPADVRVHTEQTVPKADAAKPVAEAGEKIDLPPLDQSDSIVRELVGRLSSHPAVVTWLTTDQLIRNFTTVVLNVSNGRTPSPQLTRLKPKEPFRATTGSTPAIDPRSYRRYDAYADAFAGLDAQGAARLYATLKPRIEDAYRELGYPEGDFDRTLERAVNELLRTPVIEGSVPLVSRRVAYEFADPRLESLSPAQRQLLRTGPRNVRLIQQKLREIAPLAGLRVDAPR